MNKMSGSETVRTFKEFESTVGLLSTDQDYQREN